MILRLKVFLALFVIFSTILDLTEKSIFLCDPLDNAASGQFQHKLPDGRLSMEYEQG